MSPFCEMLFHSNNSIFVSGHDTESTLALVLLVLQLSFAVARLLSIAAGAIFAKIGIVVSAWIVAVPTISLLPASTLSPPLRLRI